MHKCHLTTGIDPNIRLLNPALPKIAFGLCFPIGLVLIVLFGGDLFTGNTMIMTVSYLHNRVTAKQLALNWVLVFFSNFAGCILTAYFFGYLTESFVDAGTYSYLQLICAHKTALAPGVAFVRAIPANVLVCLAIFLGLAARDVYGKILGLYLPIFAFAVSGFEHCVANMFLLSIGMMYGMDVTVGSFLANLMPVVCGNIVGGAILVGGSEVYLYHWSHARIETSSEPLGIGIAGHVRVREHMSENLRNRLKHYLCSLCRPNTVSNTDNNNANMQVVPNDLEMQGTQNMKS